MPEEDLQDADDDEFTFDEDITLPGLDTGEDAEALDQVVEESDSLFLNKDGVTDETNTKIDLARAYIDMGDEEGARSILEEILSEGNEMQQQEAKELQEKLG